MVFKFTIDTWLDRYIPRSIVPKLPLPFRRLLGGTQPTPKADYWIWLEILISSFVGITLLEGVFRSKTVFTQHHVPVILASYGATAILCFNASSVPLAQPRNILMGHFLAALIGVCIQKLFSLSSTGRDHYWLAGSLSVAVSSVVMSICNCVHPPAGASALLPAIDEQIRMLSWWYLPVQLISSVLIISVACIFGNIIRKYPVYWWSPVSKTKEVVSESESEKENINLVYIEGLKEITIKPDVIEVPKSFCMDEIEVDWLESLQSQLTQEPTAKESGVP